MKKTALLTVSILGAALLAGCGGGGGDDASTGTPLASPEGVYGGTLTDKIGSNTFRLVVLDGNASARPFWMVYGNVDPVLGFVAEGLVQGEGETIRITASLNSFASSNALEFSNLLRTSAELISTNTVAGNTKTIAGTVNVTGNPTAINFSGGAIPGATYSFNTAASLATVEGNWSVTGLDQNNDTYDLVVDADGDFTGTPDPAPGCSFSGKFTPRASGKNVFNVTFLTDPDPLSACTNKGEASSGVAIAYTVAGGTQLILAVAKNTDRLRAAVLTGLRP